MVPRNASSAWPRTARELGGQLNLNVHFHSIVLEGVYTVRREDGAAVLHLGLPSAAPVRAPAMPRGSTSSTLGAEPWSATARRMAPAGDCSRSAA